MTKIGGPSLPTACVCCMATMMLLGKSAPVVSAAQTPFFTYTPETNVDEMAALDLDQRSIVVSLAATDEEGLSEAKNIYMLGREDSAGAMTMKRLSTLAEEEFLGVSSTYQDYVDYFGGTDYADQWISAAFGGVQTSMSNDVNIDFSKFGIEGRGAAISWGLPLLNVWMFVVALLEKAVVNCRLTGDNSIPISFLDKSVALYTGSETRKFDNYGFFLYTLTQTEGYKFGTCKKDEMSPVNKKMFEKFGSAKSNLLNNECTILQTNVREIKELMTVLLVQGVTRSMYELDIHDDYQETTQATGAAYAAALVPLLHACSEGYATMVHNDLSPGKSTKGSFEVVKNAIEQNYDCLGIKCEDVGGLVDVFGDGYYAGAEACNGVMPVNRGDNLFPSGGSGSTSESGSASSAYVPPPSASNSNFSSSKSKNDVDVTTYIIVIVVLSAFCVAFGITLLVCMCKKKKNANHNEANDSRVFTASSETIGHDDNDAAGTEAAEKEII